MIKVNHYWQAETVAIKGRDATNIPSLIVDGVRVRGPWDAVSLYVQRDHSKFIMPDGLCTDTNFPRWGRNVRDFQNVGINFILHRWSHVGAALLADDMGLGKTLQAIKAADVQGGLRLVVCPRSVALTWVAEIAKWSKDIKLKNIRTREEAGTDLTSYKWVILSYDLLPYLATNLRAATLILDEAHNFAGRKAKRGKKLLHFANLAENKLALTGTPIWSRPKDYWMLFKALFGSTFGNSWDFDHAYCGAFLNEHGGLSNKGATRTRELKHRVAFYQLRRLKKDVAKELPALTRVIRWVDADKRATAAMKNAYLHRNKGQQYKALQATLDAKLEAAMSAAKDARRFLLVTSEKKYAKFMHQALNNDDVPCQLLTGEVSPKQRHALIKLAAAKKQGIVATIDVCKEGVDGLQHVTSNGICHALDFVPLKLLQWEARLNRIGQREPVTITYIMMKESMDSWVNETVISKLDQWHALVDGEEKNSLKGSLTGRKKNQTDEELETAVLRSIYKEMDK